MHGNWPGKFNLLLIILDHFDSSPIATKKFQMDEKAQIDIAMAKFITDKENVELLGRTYSEREWNAHKKRILRIQDQLALGVHTLKH